MFTRQLQSDYKPNVLSSIHAQYLNSHQKHFFETAYIYKIGFSDCVTFHVCLSLTTIIYDTAEHLCYSKLNLTLFIGL